jgi:hypothetical protein
MYAIVDWLRGVIVTDPADGRPLAFRTHGDAERYCEKDTFPWTGASVTIIECPIEIMINDSVWDIATVD